MASTCFCRSSASKPGTRRSVSSRMCPPPRASRSHSLESKKVNSAATLGGASARAKCRCVTAVVHGLTSVGSRPGLRTSPLMNVLLPALTCPMMAMRQVSLASRRSMSSTNEPPRNGRAALQLAAALDQLAPHGLQLGADLARCEEPRARRLCRPPAQDARRQSHAMDSTRPPPCRNPRRRHCKKRLRPWERMVPNPMTCILLASSAPAILHHSRGACSDNRTACIPMGEGRRERWPGCALA